MMKNSGQQRSARMKKIRMLKYANPAADPQVAWGQEEGLFC